MFHREPEGRYRCTKSYGDSALLVLNGASLNSVNAIVALSRHVIVPNKKFYDY